MKKGNLFISVEEAQKIISHTLKGAAPIIVKTENASGFVLAKTLKSPINSPIFDHSAMDGYAFRFDDFKKGSQLQIEGESSAGTFYTGKLKRNQAVRIFTGGTIPVGADTVVMQEKIKAENGKLFIQDASLKKGSNIRMKGSQITKGETAVSKGALLNPGSLGFIASLGISHLSVFPKAKVAVIVTGDELVSPGKSLQPGQIFESNSHTLLAALSDDQIDDVKVFRVKDNFNATRKAFEKAILDFDFILFTGGISVGDYDFVGRVIEDAKVETKFYKIKQKPGKPLFFGKKNSVYIFGIPGNPASVLTCYYEFVRPALRKYINHPQPGPIVLHLPLSNSISKKPGLTHFLKGLTDYKSVIQLQGQESYILKSFISTNCFIVLKEMDVEKKTGDIVEVHLI